MTKGELLEILEDFEDYQEVRLMTQPSWPFESSIKSVVAYGPGTSEFGPDEVEFPQDEDDFTPAANPEGKVIYLVEGSQLGYGTKEAWNE